MRYKPPDFKTLSEMAAIDVGRLTEDEARDIIESIRWPNGIMLCQRHNSINLSQTRVVSQVFITGNRLPRNVFRTRANSGRVLALNLFRRKGV